MFIGNLILAAVLSAPCCPVERPVLNNVARPVVTRTVDVVRGIRNTPQRIATRVRNLRDRKPVRSFIENRRPVRRILGRIVRGR